MRHFSPPIIAVTDLTIYREQKLILQQVTWTVHRGEHWVILGANGSGKTSLLSALTGYLMPSQGQIQVLGKIFGESDWRDLRKSIGLVSSSVVKMVEPEETGLDIVASGREATVNSWKISATDQRRARVIMKQIDSLSLADRPWSVLSQGERQRLLIGRALMAKPQLLILDEPSAGLDPIAREHFLGFIQQLTRQKGAPSLVLVTHHVEEIMPGFSHLLLLKDGAVLNQGKINDTLRSDLLSQTFRAPVCIKRAEDRYNLRLLKRSQKVF